MADRPTLYEVVGATLAVTAVLAVCYGALVQGSSESMVALVSLVGGAAAFFLTPARDRSGSGSGPA